jgi:hypothetical protein
MIITARGCVCVQSNVTTGEFQLLLDVSEMHSSGSPHTTTTATTATTSGGSGSGSGGGGQQTEEVGMFLLASPGMEEAVYVGFDGANVFVDMRNSSQDNKTFQSSFRIR